MKNQINKLWTLILLGPLAIFCILCLSGCRSEPTVVDPNKPQTQAPAGRTQTIELMPETSDEQSRRHVFDEFDRELETHISYRNKETFSSYFRDDGTLKEEIVTREDGKVKSRKAYAADGTTVTEGKETRADGTVLWTMEHQKDGSTKKVTYWYDGKLVFSVEVTQKDGAYSVTYFRKSGSISGKRSGKSFDKLDSEEYFDRSGMITKRIEWSKSGEKTVSLFDGSGKLKSRGILLEEKNNWGSSWELQRIDEYDATGRLTRTAIIKNGYSVSETHTFNSDGSKIIRQVDYSGYVWREETFDADGKSIDVKEYNYNRPWESVDRYGFTETYSSDPVRNWRNQENYPYYRNSDD